MKQCPNDNFVPNTEASYLDNIVKDICSTYGDNRGINHIEGFNLPSESEILQIVQELNEVIFPGYSGHTALNLRSVHYNVGVVITKVYVQLSDQIARSFRYNCEMNNCKDCNVPEMAVDATRHLLDKLSEIRETMKLDVIAAFEGDPAARNMDEIVLSYPGIKAITIQRIAHELYCKNVPLIPRMMGEYAHRITGIDIHPGAKLGKSMFIDHGTGVVIGETSEIGNNVKIYQGVTLGALSFPKDACGKIIKGAKRHPTIEDDVTIYSGATILGNIVIGKGSLIGGNVWLTESVEPGTKVTISPPDLKIKTGNKKAGGQNA